MQKVLLVYGVPRSHQTGIVSQALGLGDCNVECIRVSFVQSPCVCVTQITP